MNTIAYLSVSSNIGDRMSKMSRVEKKLEEHPGIKIQKLSKVYETEPWPKHTVKNGRPVEEASQDWYLNQVIQISTTLSPQALLTLAQKLEKEMGKVPKLEWGSREIDIDILLYGKELIDSPQLSIPHRHMTDRQFVLVPLLEIAPNLKDPHTGRAYQEFLNEIKDSHNVIPYL